jgi:precorrin-6Y C5,15-methyltransferase (decarboxylating)
MTPWLSVVGMGEEGLPGLSPAARAVVDAADVLVGGARHLAKVADVTAEKVPWASPFAASRSVLEARRGQRVVVLASGDPMWFGAANTLIGWFGADEVSVIAHPGAFSLAAARLGWPLQEVLCLTAHGRPVEMLALHLAPGQRLLILSENGRTPEAAADLLRRLGYGASSMTVLEHLGGSAERVIAAIASDWQQSCADLNVIAIECRLTPGARAVPRVPGLRDDCFRHDGQLTKREVRAVTLAALAPLPGELLWDVGAGCGSISIEWMRAGGRAIAVEPRPDRADLIGRNAAALGVPGLKLIRGTAPDDLPQDDSPDAIFVGGGVSKSGMLEFCWNALKPGGRLVCNAVTIEGEAALLAFHAGHGGELTRLAVSRQAPVGGFSIWHPALPVTQYAGWKA